MWSELPEEQKEKYKLLITNFASLSEAFSQKFEQKEDEIVAPIINSKYQETAFQKSFGAKSEDIANTSYDASLKLKNGHKYLVGIKAFGIGSCDQKIAQFKSNSIADDWNSLLQQIQKNAQNCISQEDADNINEKLYKQLAIKIATLRNARLESSKAQIRGFNPEQDDIKAVYHVLMASKKNTEPRIYVGETDYLPINIDSLKVLGSTTVNNPTNFKFTDGCYTYKYTSADSQLLMDFKNKDIVCEEWNVEYLTNPFYIFENLHKYTQPDDEILESVSWMIANKNGEIEESSGFNSFDGQTKLAKNNRKNAINRFKDKYQKLLSAENLDFIITRLEDILCKNLGSSKEETKKKKEIRRELLDFVTSLENETLLNDIEKLVCRSATEMYIPIPEAKIFHNERPNFFANNIGTFKSDGKTLALPKDKRKFTLEFLASGNTIEAYINQDFGKAIQSTGNQDILGKWILWDVFKLKRRELLTSKRLDELEINGIRLVKFKDSNRGIGLEFIWIDPDNPPLDTIGWVKC